VYIVDLPGDTVDKGAISRGQLFEVDGRTRSKLRPTGIYLGSHDFRASVTYSNTGESLINPTGVVEVTDLSGDPVELKDPQLDGLTTYPDGSADREIALKGLPKLGVFHVKARLTSKEMGDQTKSLGTIILIPWWFLIVVLVIVAIVAYAGYRIVIWIRERRAAAAAAHHSARHDADEFEDVDTD
jgi:hypothetical protein